MIPRPDRRRVSVRYRERRRILKNSTRRGNVLILFAMMLFGLMALAALVIDLGFARLAQRQMQSAVDSAAIEGLRFRDELPPGLEDCENLELARRVHVRRWVAWSFDDDLLANSQDDQLEQCPDELPDDPHDDFNFGAGPIVGFTGGTGDPELFASQSMMTPEVPVYKPTGENALQLNTQNRPEGDMVTGTPLEAWSIEDGDAAFLVRMRRTNDPDGLDRQEGISSAGPPLPYLFARGSLMHRGSVGSGITARATSIADLRPVVRVGVARPTIDLMGALGLAISIDEWEEMEPDESRLATPTGARTIGEPISVAVDGPPLPGDGYVGIHQTIDGTERIVGFVSARSDSEGNVTMRSDAGSRPRIASENASAVFAPPSSGNNNSMPNAATLRTVIQVNHSLPDLELNDILHAPVSVR